VLDLSWFAQFRKELSNEHDRGSVNPAKTKLCPGLSNPFPGLSDFSELGSPQRLCVWFMD